MRLASGTSTNRIFLQFSKRKSFLLKALVCFSFARMINITYLAIFLFLIHHCACNLWSALSVSVRCVHCTHSTRSRAIKSPKKNGKIFKHKRTNTMSCPNTTPDVGEFPLTACEYELFQAASICLPGSRFFSTFSSRLFVIIHKPVCMWIIRKQTVVNFMVHFDLCDLPQNFINDLYTDRGCVGILY